ncbi:MAG: glycyl-radical enzyme activating protein [Candidatus Eremiobacteraeota bacterium]|nr:glycyl-radical enzyme activating protein [Candidatus Eremiobacteraeota bacterium]
MKTSEIPDGLIFDIQGHSVHDGPGCRTLIFMAGCPLRCEWCANPEGQYARPVLMYRPARCRRRPWSCVSACPREAITCRQNQEIPLSFNRALCDECRTYECITACFSEALVLSGAYYSLEKVMHIIRRDRDYWGEGGGITIGGGEPLKQPSFVTAVLESAGAAYIHTAIETSAMSPRETFHRVLAHAEWAFIDIKHMDPVKHREGTGADVEPILANISSLGNSSWSGRAVIRVPVIPGYNDTEENMRATGRFVRSAGLTEMNLLPFHRLGASKYTALGRACRYGSTESPADEHVDSLAKYIEDEGVTCYRGHDTPF